MLGWEYGPPPDCPEERLPVPSCGRTLHRSGRQITTASSQPPTRPDRAHPPARSVARPGRRHTPRAPLGGNQLDPRRDTPGPAGAARTAHRADTLTLIRANLPALPGRASRWSGPLAIVLDLAGGRLARRQGAVSPFGVHADTWADTAYWTWLTLRHEPSRTVRTVHERFPLPPAPASRAGIGKAVVYPRRGSVRPLGGRRIRCEGLLNCAFTDVR
jgi:hypothetical protein